MSQPPPHDPYQGPPPGMPPQGPHNTGGQPPMGPPTGGQPPMGPPPPPPPGGPGIPGSPGDPYGHDPYGHGGDPYNQGGSPYGPPGGPHPQQGADPYGAPPQGASYAAAPPIDPYGNPYGQQQPKKTSPWLFLGLGCAALFVIGVVVVVLVSVLFNGDDAQTVEAREPSDQSEAIDPLDEEPEEPVEPEEPAGPGVDTSDMETVGSEFEYDGMSFTVTGVDVVDELNGTEADGEFLVVEIDVADASGTGANWFWMDEQHVYEADGTQYEEAYDLTQEINGDVYQVLDPGGAVSGVTIAFDVPDADDITYLGLSTQTYGGNETYVSLVD
ncbi:DUF4352 domain-containing protein [Nocardiopsis sp. FIRDI 009]|uniref:DUF4352 domain-containing protein n=1 Tax=Nocardiopsis sp. FIRDI 009 TaxID=714197 RepID=UPI00130059EA|nr:DUF4352 domain-containing protein [Nocardiopsis sp. FIRDI 009]